MIAVAVVIVPVDVPGGASLERLAELAAARGGPFSSRELAAS
jgi:hypothetical protein